jgi:hypothetical protein
MPDTNIAEIVLDGCGWDCAGDVGVWHTFSPLRFVIFNPLATFIAAGLPCRSLGC